MDGRRKGVNKVGFQVFFSYSTPPPSSLFFAFTYILSDFDFDLF